MRLSNNLNEVVYDGTNFRAYKLSVLALLRKKGISYVLTETEGTEFKKDNEKAFGIMTEKMTIRQADAAQKFTMCKELWQNLITLNESKNDEFLNIKRRELYELKCGENQNIKDHIADLEYLQTILKDTSAPVQDSELVVVLMGSMPESWNGFLTSLRGKGISGNWEKVVSAIYAEEMARKCNNMGKPEETETIMTAKERSKKNLKCFNCGKKNHLASQCKEKRTVKCYNCHKLGHLMKDCKTDKEALNSCKENKLELLYGLNSYILDSGATSHMFMDKKYFGNFKNISIKVQLGDDRNLNCTGIGNVKLGKYGLNLDNALYVPNLKRNLISLSKLADTGYHMYINRKRLEIYKEDKLAALGLRSGNLYELVEMSGKQMVNVSKTKEIIDWHKRFGHLNFMDLKYLRDKNLVTGIENINEYQCESCLKGKMTKRSSKKEGSRATGVLEIIHSDICGPMSEETFGSQRYFISFIDDFTRFCTIYLIRKKDQAFEKFKEFKNLMENRFEKKIKILRSDNGGEYISKEFEIFLKNSGIQNKFTVSYNPHQNGIAERMNRTLVEMARTMLQNSNLGKRYWGEAISTACYIRNRCPTKAIRNQTPYESIYKNKPDVSHFLEFGKKVLYYIPNEKRTKFDSKCGNGIFMGYGDNFKGYRIYDLDNKKLIRCTYQDVKEIWNETNRNDHLDDNGGLELEHKPDFKLDVENESENDSESETELKNTEIIPSLPTERRYPNRNRKPPPAPEGRLLARYWEKANNVEMVPESYAEAINDKNKEKWETAITDELTSIEENDTWELVDLPKGKRAIGCRWVFAFKYNENGAVERYKARLVAKGYNQRHGIDYNETFAPVVKFQTIRMILTIAAIEDMEIHQLDVKTAFLNGDLNEEVYMEQPDGYKVKGFDNMVLKLKKSLYGLKQASRSWNNKLNEFLIEQGFIVGFNIFVKFRLKCRSLAFRGWSLALGLGSNSNFLPFHNGRKMRFCHF